LFVWKLPAAIFLAITIGMFQPACGPSMRSCNLNDIFAELLASQDSGSRQAAVFSDRSMNLAATLLVDDT